ncbi:uncharacterized protein AC631_02438 [Debaryomyces fabryi]|uniref:Uncharacterized protein n=1 Tax=Debaryomyces fabryi TaxID=58627 RepID=A0A0V1Q066_9ASCO|nr:uncharacterized protein AC631_02438 [Debaryomyces fabryi]KSA01830.1 hypothetical protein AC631_02438 [Debaryomyces fabryi]CUM46756.1 unnamed protein product [Debaryomyces fabryi]
MIDSDAFMKSSPFQVIHGADSDLNYNLKNTTPDLLKFQLQEQYRNKLSDLNENHHDLPNLNLLYTQFLQGSFNNHLQTNIDQEHISLDADVPSLSSTPIPEAEDEEYTRMDDNKANYINLRVLIENSVFDTSKINKDAILTLPRLKKLKQEIEDKKEFKQYLLSRYGIAQQFFSDIIDSDKQESLKLDAPLLLKFLKLNNYLQKQLLQVSGDLDNLILQLNNHNLTCLVLGYIEDIKLTSLSVTGPPLSTSSPFTSPKRNPKSSSLLIEQPLKLISKTFDTLFSHIASIAVQRNIQLPQPSTNTDPETIQSRIQWAQDCIDTILSVRQPGLLRIPASEKSMNISTDEISSRNDFSEDHSFLNESSITSASPQKAQNSGKLLAEYKTALNDLRFSHQYLAKEYEHSRESSLKAIQEYRKKNSILEKELNKLKSADTSNQPSIIHDGSNSIDAKDREISKLRKELSLLKVDKLGIKNSAAKLASPTGSNSALSALSPITSSFPTTYTDTDGNEDEPVIPSRPTSISSNSTSNGILRTEFKKIVEDIHEQYELQLTEERYKRKQLQDKIQAYNSIQK